MPDGWQPLGSLAVSRDALSAAVGQVRERLAAAGGRRTADIELRVAASVTQLGLCARLIAPVLGAAALGGGLHVDLGEAWWAPPPGGPFGLSLPRTALTAGDEGEPLAVLAGPVTALTRATAPMSVSAQVLWGNVASAVNGAAAMIAAARPELAPAAAVAAGAMLSFPALAGSYQGRVATPGFRRHSCCLIYQLAPPGAS